MTNGIHFEPVRDEASPCSSLSSVSSFSLQDSPERQPYFHRVVRDEASPCCFSLPQQDPPERQPSSSSINRMTCGLLPRSLPSRALFQFIDFGMSIPRPLLKDFEFEGDALQEINLTFRKIVDATRNFSPQKIIDSGLSGTVYKAYISGQILAVKKIRSRSINDMKVFVNEVETLKFLKHGNLVQLLGWSAQWSHHLLLIYEHMKKNSLQRTFFENKSEFFSWERRCMICLQIAKGLAYLHEKEIIHRDIKPRNILLDENLNAKISEFGLATVYHKEQRRNVTKLSGTPGYTAPEAYLGNFTEKTDVYSYGMVVLEIISGRNNKSLNTSGGYDFLLDEAYGVQRDGNILDFVDAKIKNTVDFKEACNIFKLGMLCVHYSPSLRPTMSEVVGVLEETKTIEDISICS